MWWSENLVKHQKVLKYYEFDCSLCDSGDAYILVNGNITVNNTAGAGAAANNDNKKVIFKNCAPFSNCISKINNTDIDNAKYIGIVMPVYNLIEYSDNYSKRSGSLWKWKLMTIL